MKSLKDAEKLFKKGILKKDTFERIAQRYAAGGPVDVESLTNPDLLQAQALAASKGAGTSAVQPNVVIDSSLPNAAMTTPAQGDAEKFGAQKAMAAQVEQNNQKRAALGMPTSAASAVGQKDSGEPMVDVVPAGSSTKPVQPSGLSAIASLGQQTTAGPDRQIAQAVGTYGKAIAQLDSEMQKIEQLREEKRSEREKFETQAKASLMKRLEDLDRLPQIDPNRFYGTMSTGSKLLAGVAMMFGGKDAVAVMQNAVNRDIDAQKAEHARAMNKAEVARGIYSDMYKMFQDEEQAELGTRLAMVNIIGKKLDAMAAQVSNQVQLQNYSLARDRLNLEKQQLMIDFMRRTGQLYGQTGKDRISDEIFQKVPEEYRKQAIEERGNLEGMKAAEKSIASQFDEFSKIGSVAASVPFTDSQTNAETIQAGLLANVVKALGSNPSDRDMRVIERLLPSKWDRDTQVQAKKMRMLQFIRQKQKELKPTPTLMQFGVRVDPQINFTPQGS